MDISILNLRASLAMRTEDARIARKHRDEAAARPWSLENQRAYEGARDWANTCGEREAEARGRLIRALEEKERLRRIDARSCATLRNSRYYPGGSGAAHFGAAARRDAAMEACKYCGPDHACPRHSELVAEGGR